MSELLSRNHAERIAFFANHIAPWSAQATNIGTTAGAVTDLDTKTQAAAAALADQQQKKDAAEAATLALFNAIDVMTNAGMAIVEQVHTKARSAGNGVYALAVLPEPATPSPKAAPGKPTDLVVTLDESGVLNLKWKCPNPAGTSGTMYQIWRRIGGSGDFTYVGGVGEKKFVDDTLPAGSSAVTYQMQAVRSTSHGPWAQFNVNFGVSTGGAMTASVTETQPSPKMAA